MLQAADDAGAFIPSMLQRTTTDAPMPTCRLPDDQAGGGAKKET
jgi:hypothetical protein